MAREKEPFIHKGDKILMTGGPCGGSWDVMDARWARRDDTSDERVELVLRRGSSMYTKTIFNATTMKHQSEWPCNVLSRDINIQKPIKFKAK